MTRMPILRANQVLTPDGWAADMDISIGADGRIGHVSPASGTADHHFDIALPAPVNLHSHSFQRAMAGLTEARGPDPSDSFWTWRRLMYQFLHRLNPDQIEAIAALAFLEMAEAGFGAVAEFHYLHHGPDGEPYANLGELSERIAAAADEVGLGLTLLPVLYQFGGCDGRALQGGQLRFANDPDRYARLFGGVEAIIASGPGDWTCGAAPHSLRAVDDAGLSMLQTLADTRPIHMHIAEQTAEVDEVLIHLGARPVEWLLANHMVDNRWCLIHATQMTSAETTSLARTGAVAGLCPITEANLGDGVFDGTGFFGANGRIGVGSDSNIRISLFEELRVLEYSQRLWDRRRAVLASTDKSTGRRLFDAAVTGGAQAAGRGTGGLAQGEFADIIAVSTQNVHLAGKRGDNILDALIFAGGDAAISDVWSAGRHIVRQGRHIARDRIEARYISVIADLAEAL